MFQIMVDEEVLLQVFVVCDDCLQFVDFKDGGLIVDFDIFVNDEDLDGIIDVFDVEIGEGGILFENGKVCVIVMEELQFICYMFIDCDGLVVLVFIFVFLCVDLCLIFILIKLFEVVSGEIEMLLFFEYVMVVGGGEVVIIEKVKVSVNYVDGVDLLKDVRIFVYILVVGYFGFDFFMFEVIDGIGLDDFEGCKVMFSILINVLLFENQQFMFVQGQVNVVLGELVMLFDLVVLMDDFDFEDKGKYDYVFVGGEGKGIFVCIEGGDKLVVEVVLNVKKGIVIMLKLCIFDGIMELVEGMVEVMVIVFICLMFVVNIDMIVEVDVGKIIVVFVFVNDYNLFLEMLLKIVLVVVEFGVGDVEFIVDQVIVILGDFFVGMFVVCYCIQDVMEDFDCEVNGQIVVIVQDVLDVLGVLVIVIEQDCIVVVLFLVLVNNGVEIIKYMV